MPVALATRIAGWLKAQQILPGGRIVDSVHQVSGSYSDGFAALAFGLLGWSESRDRALSLSLLRPGQSEFDHLAQAILLVLCPSELDDNQKSSIGARPMYAGKEIVSNNWALFRALTRLLLNQPAADFSLLERQLPSGLFPDSPFGQATPVCYHAKICATLALAASLRADRAPTARLHQGLAALADLVSPQGILVPYGRSRNTLFAYGSAYLALRLGAHLYQDGILSWAAERLLVRMQAFQQPDGHIPACLNHQEWLRKDWDIYINNPDYNAYAAGCLLLASRLAPHPPSAQHPPWHHRNHGPIFTIRHAQGYFACATSGEFSPHGSPFFCDTRYAGMHPLLWDNGQTSRSFEENYCWDGREKTRACLVDPRVSRWIPYLETDGGRCWVRNYENVDWALDDSILRVSGRGRLSRSRAIPRWARYLESRLAGRPARQFDNQTLNREVETHLKLDLNKRCLDLSSNLLQKGHLLEQSTKHEVLCPK